MREWGAAAGCKGLPVEWFFSEGQPKAECKAACRSCPVQTECLIDQLEWEGDSCAELRVGFIGGLGARDRLRLSQLPRLGLIPT